MHLLFFTFSKLRLYKMYLSHSFWIRWIFVITNKICSSLLQDGYRTLCWVTSGRKTDFFRIIWVVVTLETLSRTTPFTRIASSPLKVVFVEFFVWKLLFFKAYAARDLLNMNGGSFQNVNFLYFINVINIFYV